MNFFDLSPVIDDMQNLYNELLKFLMFILEAINDTIIMIDNVQFDSIPIKQFFGAYCYIITEPFYKIQIFSILIIVGIAIIGFITKMVKRILDNIPIF